MPQSQSIPAPSVTVSLIASDHAFSQKILQGKDKPDVEKTAKVVLAQPDLQGQLAPRNIFPKTKESDEFT